MLMRLVPSLARLMPGARADSDAGLTRPYVEAETRDVWLDVCFARQDWGFWTLEPRGPRTGLLVYFS